MADRRARLRTVSSATDSVTYRWPFDRLLIPLSGWQYRAVRISVIMPAFNEASGIGGVLRSLLDSPQFDTDLEIVVVANGCTDDTAEIARSFGVRVVEIPTPSKTAALNAGDRAVGAGDRIYLDADVPVTAELLRQLATAVTRPGVAAAVPRPVVDSSSSFWPVRAYYAVNARLPVFRNRLFGRGIIALSGEARGRFDQFPELTADDMFLDAIAGPHEKVEIDAVVRVDAPRRTADLVRRVARARDGNAEFWRFLRSAPPEYGLPADPVPGPSAWSWLRDVLLRSPELAPAAVCYVGIILLAEAKRRSPGWSARSGWGRTASVQARR
ncbi:glycosyltransferase family 2 protein [Micromonospora sp. WMMD812]|uniref:glycosyltransferase family 2 protein n=1 Tax=Micromonospora sp. WMMD812 TaxID=3015152 RepID=UPI00248AD945|nr:glycosyltransferase family 2 protein [Micromonospora sp. WMMD812]WBB69606.1 glycosyltransferase family 2 protein [Micromonospora sp. WMMD812]